MSTLSDYNINVQILQSLPEPTPPRFIVIEGAEWADAVSMEIQCRKTHPEEAIEIYPRDNGTFTVIREVVQ